MTSNGTTAIICKLTESVKDKLKQLRFQTTSSTGRQNAAIVMKINKEKFEIELDEYLEDNISFEELGQELPDNQPRFIVYSYAYTHPDGRRSFPLVFIYWSPVTVKPETHMLYAGCKSFLVQQCEVGKVFDVDDGNDFNEKWLKEKLAFFK